MTILGAIADDFTGATDLAGLLARSGVSVSLRLGLPSEPADGLADVEVIALKCRTIPAAEAVAQSRRALDWLRHSGARQFYWKYCSTFDSTPAGNIGPVAEALAAALGADQVIYCPAFPENGRRVFMGNLFVGHQPLAESPMKDHPLTPMTDSDLTRLLAPQLDGAPVGLIDWPTLARGPASVRTELEILAAREIRHIVSDAVSDHDLETLARACRDMVLLSGGSAFAATLPPLWREAGLTGAALPPAVPQDLGSGAIVLSGSCSAMTRAQVAALRPHIAHLKLDPLTLARDGTGAARDWLANHPANQPVMIYATAEPAEVRHAQSALGTAHAGEIVEACLAQLAQDARAEGRARFVVAGGETSGAVAHALGVRRLMIGPEIAPGVPWTFAEDAQGPLALALKSGNFGAESFFSDAFAALDRIA
ncbi:3-oxo-tetronate kinase [Paracoccus aminophilus]|uniref:3-oxo-tetronate kinase n=1 Tax=Paracoccus aminophilus JCM 7686 TaxID=1367847 RepID=S5Y3L6_PARAH|nr:3-oxo-tetronate kinase [Paracoccus aminophilus]AGT10345.1 hypothetical protein JCM7686_3310 [Paracoccus aminophilus JCM 7686]